VAIADAECHQELVVDGPLVEQATFALPTAARVDVDIEALG
jgi:hypothetical protein